MARHLFGLGPADYAIQPLSTSLVLVPGAVGTVWTALTGGSQLTDLQDLSGNAITQITADSKGQVGFYGPDTVASCYVDFGFSPRYLMTATDLGAIADSLTAGKLDKTGGTVSGALTVAGTLTASADAVVATDVQTPVVQGGTGSGGNLTLKSTTHATKGKLLLGAAGSSVYDEVNDRLGIGTNAPGFPLQVKGGSAGSNLISTLVTGDTVSRFRVDADGTHSWGPGNTAVDTNLYRASTNTLKTDNSLTVAGSLAVAGSPSLGGGVGVFGLLNAGTPPSSNPTGGGVLYAASGRPRWRDTAGNTPSLDGPYVCTSSTHPASPYTGMEIWETDTGKKQIWNGSAWQLLAGTTPLGFVAEAVDESTNPATSGTTELVVQYVNFTAVAGRRYQVRFTSTMGAGTSGDAFQSRFRYQATSGALTAAGTAFHWHFVNAPTITTQMAFESKTLTGLTGGTTYAIGFTIQRTGGTGVWTFKGAATGDSRVLQVYDVGV